MSRLPEESKLDAELASNKREKDFLQIDKFQDGKSFFQVTVPFLSLLKRFNKKEFNEIALNHALSIKRKGARNDERMILPFVIACGDDILVIIKEPNYSMPGLLPEFHSYGKLILKWSFSEKYKALDGAVPIRRMIGENINGFEFQIENYSSLTRTRIAPDDLIIRIE